ncbi:MAG: hypothetical protein KAS93_08240 [Gammaproteobacteria bacterium]|nr:hypothetical protein [Gammaproteobacteria bacterium]
MALDRAVRYSGFWLPGDTARPFGNAKNATTETSKDGSPWEKDYIDDIDSFLQGLLSRNNITVSGIPDTVLVSDTLTALGFEINKPFADLSSALNSLNKTRVFVGALIRLKEHTAGNGGAGYWRVDLVTDVVVNGINIVASIGIPTLAFVFVPDVIVRASQLGANPTSTSQAIMNTLATFPILEFDVETKKTGTFIVSGGTKLIFSADVVQDDNNAAFRFATSEWSVEGRGTVKRAAGVPTALIAGSIGFDIRQTAFIYHISGAIRVEHFSDAGVKFDGGAITGDEVSRSSVVGLVAHNNWDNWQFISGFPAEYITYTNCISTDAANRGVLHEAGNLNWLGGSITGNAAGIHLSHPDFGTNPHHGMFIGTHINHNTAYAIWADEVAAGMDFVGCHIYDNAISTTGRIKLNNCRGINITDGTVSAQIEVTTDGVFQDHIGYNKITGNRMEANAGIVSGAGFDTSKLIVEDNFDFEGDWTENDAARVYATKRVAGGTQVLAGSTIYNLADLMGTKIVDNRNALATNFVAPFNMDLVTSVSLDLGFSASITGAEYIAFKRNGLIYFTAKMVNFVNSTNTLASIDMTHECPLSKDDTMTVELGGFQVGTSITLTEGCNLRFKSNR